jgi:hypothetical protein
MGDQEKTWVMQMLRANGKWIWDYFKEFSAAILLQKQKGATANRCNPLI